MRRLFVVVLACLALVGCDKSLSGTYVARTGSGVVSGIVLQKMEFVSSTEVNITLLAQTFRVPYRIDHDQLLLTANGQALVFKIDDDGCLDGGTLYGKLCKA